MKTVDVATLEGRRYPAGRLTKSVVGLGRPIECDGFSMGVVVLDPNGGQVPWHAHVNEEVYFVLEGEVELALDQEVSTILSGEVVHIPPNSFHQLTNLGAVPARFVYVYSPTGDVAHWREELAGTLARAGVDAPKLPVGAAPQKV